MFDKLIFLCTDNTSVSPMAEVVYRSLSENKEVIVASRGMVVLFPEPVNPKVLTVLESRGLAPRDTETEELKAEDIGDNTLILAMTDRLKKQAVEKFGIIPNIYTLKEYNGETGDVKDPYGGSLIEYEECFNEIVRLIKKTLYRQDEEVRGASEEEITENTDEEVTGGN